jgi:hypothetical protein
MINSFFKLLILTFSLSLFGCGGGGGGGGGGGATTDEMSKPNPQYGSVKISVSQGPSQLIPCNVNYAKSSNTEILDFNCGIGSGNEIQKLTIWSSNGSTKDTPNSIYYYSLIENGTFKNYSFSSNCGNCGIIHDTINKKIAFNKAAFSLVNKSGYLSLETTINIDGYLFY